LSLFLNYGNLSGQDCGPTAVLTASRCATRWAARCLNYSASPTIRNCIFTNNVGDLAAHAQQRRLSLVVNCAFVNNSCSAGAGRSIAAERHAHFRQLSVANMPPLSAAAPMAVYSLRRPFDQLAPWSTILLFASGGGLYCSPPPMKS